MYSQLKLRPFGAGLFCIARHRGTLLPPPALRERRHRGLARRLVALLPPPGPVYVSPASPRIARSAARPLSVSA